MSRIPRSVRILVAGLLAVSTLTVFGVSPAGAAATGSVVNNGAGGVTVTYTVGQGETVGLHVYTALTACDTSSFPPPPQYYLLSGLGSAPLLGASPATVDQTTSVHTGQSSSTIPAGTYQFCLYDITGGNFVLLSGVQTTIGTVTPTTSSTTTSTTTAPAADPVAPAFTG